MTDNKIWIASRNTNYQSASIQYAIEININSYFYTILFSNWIFSIWNQWTVVSTLLSLISSVYRDLPHWRSNQRPLKAKPKLYYRAIRPHHTQVTPNQLVMVIAWPRLTKRIVNMHYYKLKGKDIDVHFLFEVEELFWELNHHDQKIRRIPTHDMHDIREHRTAVSTFLGLTSSVYRNLFPTEEFFPTPLYYFNKRKSLFLTSTIDVLHTYITHLLVMKLV